MVCSVHWYAYFLQYENDVEFISFYQDYCLLEKYEEDPQFGDYHAMIDGFGACINSDTKRFEFLLQSI